MSARSLAAYDRAPDEWHHEKKLRDAAQKWLWDQTVPKLAVSLDARQSIWIEGTSERLDEAKLSKAISVFMWKLSRRYFPARLVKKGVRLYHAFVWEYGEAREYHAHGWIEVPPRTAPNVFSQEVLDVWCETLFGLDAHMTTDCNEGWIGYCLKPKTTGRSMDQIDYENVHLPSARNAHEWVLP